MFEPRLNLLSKKQDITMMNKKQIKRAVFGVCVIGAGETVTQPIKVTITVNQRRCWCWPWLTTSRKVATFRFNEVKVISVKRGFMSRTAALDLEYLFKCSRKSVDSSEVKICILCHLGKKYVACIGLEDFLGQLMRRGRPEDFVMQVHEGKVSLTLPFWRQAYRKEGVAAHEEEKAVDVK